MKVVDRIVHAFRAPGLRKRILLTLAMLGVCRIGALIPTPGVNTAELQRLFDQAAGTALGFANLFSGGQLERLTIFSLGIIPYAYALMIVYLLTAVIPALGRLRSEGKQGRRKIIQGTGYLAIALSIAQSSALALGLEQQGLAHNPGIGFVLMTVTTLTAGTAFVIWLAHQISERGIGTGISLIFFTGIIATLPSAVVSLYENTFVTGQWGAIQLVLILPMMVLAAFAAWAGRAERRILQGAASV